jgi:hypothetical protein
MVEGSKQIRIVSIATIGDNNVTNGTIDDIDY